MNSTDSTIPLRGLQYIASPLPNSFTCHNRLQQKVNVTNLLSSNRSDKDNATLPVLNDTQCHSKKSTLHR